MNHHKFLSRIGLPAQESLLIKNQNTQNHRINSVGKDPQGSQSSAPGPAQDCPQEPQHVPENVICLLNCFPEGTDHTRLITLLLFTRQ